MNARPPSSVTVRAAEPGDAFAIRSLDGLSASSVALLDHDLAAADRCCIVAELPTAGGSGDAGVAGDVEVADAEAAGDVEVVGYAAAIVQLGEAQIIDLVVAPSSRNRGVGGRLLDALLAKAVARGAGAASLEVATDNAAAQALYRRRGFVVEGRRPRYYRDGTDALIMWRHPIGAAAPAAGTAGRVAGTAGRVAGTAGRVAATAGRVAGTAGHVTGTAGRVTGTAGSATRTAGPAGGSAGASRVELLASRSGATSAAATSMSLPSPRPRPAPIPEREDD